ncbi:MAG: anthranilate synthase component I [Gammaproteobacteria bacterium]|nr:MAG: anthranilate synthase component I [Gammaproteobacteria bacterium]RKZ71263.1 MAG: anthranilate synthase component I [Gammaproteobacteria bacterium]
MTPEQFKQLAEGNYNRIPLMREVLADMDTPLSAYKKLADEPYSYLFESVQGGEKWGRYSIIGLGSSTILRVSGHQLSIEEDGKIVKEEVVEDPLQAVEAYHQQFRVPEIASMPRFSGGMVGYFGYDCVRYIETRLDYAHMDASEKDDPLQCPDILLMVSEQLVVFDNLNGKLHIIVHANPEQSDAYENAQKQLDALAEKLTVALTSSPNNNTRHVDEKDFVSGFTQEGFQQGVDRIKDYIVEGDAMQVVLSQRLSIPFNAPPIDLYRALRCLNPSPYMFYLNLKDFHIVGSSPEILVRLEDNEVTVRPIAGTRPRGADAEEDLALEEELLADPKELAEHLMLIDLGRNDTGRVAEMGSVKVTDNMIVERYSHVMHIVSNVVGTLKGGLSAIDVFRATFPAGTVSGAPKIRAMEIIDELEPVKRGVYAGAVGYLSWNGNMDTAIAIRTAVIKDDTLHIQAGAGIVADSVPENEWNETMNKGRAIFRAVAMAEKGLG